MWPKFPFLWVIRKQFAFVFNLTNSEITNKISAESVATAKRGVFNAASLIGSSGVGKSYGLYAGACNINSAMYIFRDSGIFRVTRDQKARKTVDMANRSVSFFAGGLHCSFALDVLEDKLMNT